MRWIWPAAATESPRPASVSRETLNRAHDQPAIGLVALAVRLHVAALAQIRVHDLAFGRPHGLELDRPVIAQSLGGRAIRHSVQRRLATLAVAGGVDRDLLAVLGAAERGPENEVLERVDGGSVLADQQAEVVAVHRGADLLVALLDVDGRVQAERVDHPPDDRSRALRRLLGDLLRHCAPSLHVHLRTHACRPLRPRILGHFEADTVGSQPGKTALEGLHCGPLRLAKALALRLGDKLLGPRLLAYGHRGPRLSAGAPSASSSCAVSRVEPWSDRRSRRPLPEAWPSASPSPWSSRPSRRRQPPRPRWPVSRARASVREPRRAGRAAPASDIASSRAAAARWSIRSS